jgi:hypothetical protein
MSELTIAARFRGPPNSGNGGYVAGRLAAHVPASCVRVRLIRPPPLDQALRVVPASGLETSESSTRWELLDESAPESSRLVAWAEPAAVDVVLPPVVSHEQARAASQQFPGWQTHPYPDCFVCGTQRAPRDGLRIFAGPVHHLQVAAPWIPDASLADKSGHVRSEFVWAALDCPGAVAADWGGRALLLGEITVKLICPVRAGRPCTIMGWRLSVNDRRFEVATALFDADEELCAVSNAWWIRPKLVD